MSSASITSPKSQYLFRSPLITSPPAPPLPKLQPQQQDQQHKQMGFSDPLNKPGKRLNVRFKNWFFLNYLSITFLGCVPVAICPLIQRLLLSGSKLSIKLQNLTNTHISSVLDTVFVLTRTYSPVVSIVLPC